MSLQELNNRRAGGRARGRGGSDTSAIFWLTSTTLNTEVHWAAIPSQLNGCAGIVWSVWAICSHHSGGLFGEESRGEERITPGLHSQVVLRGVIITVCVLSPSLPSYQLWHKHHCQTRVGRIQGTLGILLRGESRGNIEQSQWSDEY